jgi:phospholipase/lecithinase/hemolysin
MRSAYDVPQSRVKRALLSLAACALLLSTGLMAQVAAAQVVVFGTSLSDPGNAFALLSDPASPFRLSHPLNVPPYDKLDEFLVPGLPYAKGGHHFSNGATWIEQYALGRGLGGAVGPAFLSSNPNATNYAVGGTRARSDVTGPVTLSFQVQTFLSTHPQAPSDAIYVIEMGANDVRDALAAFQSGGAPAATQIIGDAIGAISTEVASLYGSGARRFLVLNVPNIGLTPAVGILDQAVPGAAGLATMLTVSFNTNLATALDFAALALPGVEIARLDLFGEINAVVLNPAAFGLSNVDTPCVTPEQPPFTCQTPNKYLFWDGIHPTKAGHAIVANEAAAVISATWPAFPKQ